MNSVELEIEKLIAEWRKTESHERHLCADELELLIPLPIRTEEEK